MSFHIMNADLYQTCNLLPSTTKVGQQFTLPKMVKNCPWKSASGSIIPAGNYVIKSRKGFSGGSLEIVQA